MPKLGQVQAELKKNLLFVQNAKAEHLEQKLKKRELLSKYLNFLN
jgi:membrane carboxypeptidase/penicillin-binding protein PbpC